MPDLQGQTDLTELLAELCGLMRAALAEPGEWKMRSFPVEHGQALARKAAMEGFRSRVSAHNTAPAALCAVSVLWPDREETKR